MRVQSLLPSRRIVNMFGAVGYSLLIVTYAIVAAMVFYWLISNGHLTPQEVPVYSTAAPTTPTPTEVTPVAGIVFEILAYVITAFMTLTVLFVVVTLPYWLGRSGSYLLRRAILLCGLAVTRVSLFIGKIISCAVVVLPIAVLVAQDISQISALIIISMMTCLALAVFMLQHYLAKMNQLSPEDVW